MFVHAENTIFTTSENDMEIYALCAGVFVGNVLFQGIMKKKWFDGVCIGGIAAILCFGMLGVLSLCGYQP